MAKLEVPRELQRNAQRVVDAGFEETGLLVLQNVAEVLGVPDLSQIDMLDVGCGVRFTQTILNRGVPIRSYTGIDVEPRLIHWLKENVRDPRFRFAVWEVHNAMYNKRGPPFTRASKLPVQGDFDLIGLFSVFTHMGPKEADAMLHVLRPHARPDGRLLFTAFVDERVAEFEDRVPGKPMRQATYNEKAMRALVESNGWRVVRSIPKRRDRYVAHQFLCAPAPAEPR